eukprot:scpid8890/ scgid31005/ Tudor domain-containing protein 1
MSAGQRYHVEVASLSADILWIRFLESADALENLHTVINSAYQNSTNECATDVLVSSLSCKGLVCAKYNGRWYRAKVLGFNAALKKAQVLFVDFGNVSLLDLSNLRPCLPEWRVLKHQAVPTRLADLASSSFADYTEYLRHCTSAVSRFEARFECALAAELHDVPIYSVHLVNMATGRSLSEELLEKDFRRLSYLSTSVEQLAAVAPLSQSISNTSPVQFKTEVVVACCEGPHHFFLQLKSQTDSIDMVQAMVASHCESDCCVQYPPWPSQALCARFVDGVWYRARCLGVADTGEHGGTSAAAVYNDGDSATNKYTVEFVDYGNKDAVDITCLKPISAPLVTTPSQAFVCCLYELDADEAPLQSVCEKFSERVLGKTLTCGFVKSKKMPSENYKWHYEVDLYFEDGKSLQAEFVKELIVTRTRAISKTLEEERERKRSEALRPYTLPHESLAEAEELDRQLAPGVPQLQRPLFDGVLGIANAEDVCVLSINKSIGTLTCQLQSRIKELAGIEEHLHNVLSKARNSRPAMHKGAACAVLYAEDKRWYRGVIISLSSEHVQVEFADYGTVQECNHVRELAPLPQAAMDLPCQAFRCKLTGEAGDDDELLAALIQEHSSALERSMDGVVFNAKFVCKGKHVWKVCLGRTMPSGEGCDLSSQIIERYSFKPAATCAATCAVPSNTNSCEGALLQPAVQPTAVQPTRNQQSAALCKTNASTCYSASAKPSDSDTASDATVVKCKALAGTAPPPSTSSVRRPMMDVGDVQLALGDTLDVIISYVEDDCSFWCQVQRGDQAEMISSKLQEAGAKWTARFRAKSSNIKRPQGLCVAALYPDDEQWYRARVLANVGTSHLLVTFIDFGNESEVVSSDIFPLPPDLRKLPSLAFACRLDPCLAVQHDSLANLCNQACPITCTVVGEKFDGMWTVQLLKEDGTVLDPELCCTVSHNTSSNDSQMINSHMATNNASCGSSTIPAPDNSLSYSAATVSAPLSASNVLHEESADNFQPIDATVSADALGTAPDNRCAASSSLQNESFRADSHPSIHERSVGCDVSSQKPLSSGVPDIVVAQSATLSASTVQTVQQPATWPEHTVQCAAAAAQCAAGFVPAAVGCQQRVTVVCVESVQSFWCVPCGTHSTLLRDTLEQWRNDPEATPVKQLLPGTSAIACVDFKEQRIVLTSFVQDGHASVFLPDVGQTARISCSGLLSVPDSASFTAIPPLAFHCRLSASVDVELPVISGASTSHFSSLVLGQDVLCDIVDQDKNTTMWCVHLSTKLNNNVLILLCNSLATLSSPLGTFQPVPPAVSYSHCALPQDEQAFDCLVSVARHPSQFSVCLLAMQTALSDLEVELKALYCSLSTRLSAFPGAIAGDACAVYLQAESKWCRGQVFGISLLKCKQAQVSVACNAGDNGGSTTSVHMAEVLLVDHGNVVSVPLSDVHQLDQRFLTLPSQSLLCTLRAMRPGVCDKEMTQHFHAALLRAGRVQCVFKTSNTDTQPLQVDLLLDGQSIHSHLLKHYPQQFTRRRTMRPSAAAMLARNRYYSDAGSVTDIDSGVLSDTGLVRKSREPCSVTTTATTATTATAPNTPQHQVCCDTSVLPNMPPPSPEAIVSLCTSAASTAALATVEERGGGSADLTRQQPDTQLAGLEATSEPVQCCPEHPSLHSPSPAADSAECGCGEEKAISSPKCSTSHALVTTSPGAVEARTGSICTSDMERSSETLVDLSAVTTASAPSSSASVCTTLEVTSCDGSATACQLEEAATDARAPACLPPKSLSVLGAQHRFRPFSQGVVPGIVRNTHAAWTSHASANTEQAAAGPGTVTDCAGMLVSPFRRSSDDSVTDELMLHSPEEKFKHDSPEPLPRLDLDSQCAGESMARVSSVDTSTQVAEILQLHPHDSIKNIECIVISSEEEEDCVSGGSAGPSMPEPTVASAACSNDAECVVASSIDFSAGDVHSSVASCTPSCSTPLPEFRQCDHLPAVHCTPLPEFSQDSQDSQDDHLPAVPCALPVTPQLPTISNVDSSMFSSATSVTPDHQMPDIGNTLVSSSSGDKSASEDLESPIPPSGCEDHTADPEVSAAYSSMNSCSNPAAAAAAVVLAETSSNNLIRQQQQQASGDSGCGASPTSAMLMAAGLMQDFVPSSIDEELSLTNATHHTTATVPDILDAALDIDCLPEFPSPPSPSSLDVLVDSTSGSALDNALAMCVQELMESKMTTIEALVMQRVDTALNTLLTPADKQQDTQNVSDSPLAAPSVEEGDTVGVVDITCRGDSSDDEQKSTNATDSFVSFPALDDEFDVQNAE